MTESFDTLEPFRRAMITDFVFRPSRYEVWAGGKMTGSGTTHHPITAKVGGEVERGAVDIDINIGDSVPLVNVCRVSNYDICTTTTTRVQLLTIPLEERDTDSVGLAVCRSNMGPTCRNKSFGSDEPFCCNLFFVDGMIAKITFSINHPERLVEFYS